MGFFDFFKSDYKKKVDELREIIQRARDRFRIAQDKKSDSFCVGMIVRLKNCHDLEEYEQIEKDWNRFYQSGNTEEDSSYISAPNYRRDDMNYTDLSSSNYSDSGNSNDDSKDSISGNEGEFGGAGSSSSWSDNS